MSQPGKWQAECLSDSLRKTQIKGASDEGWGAKRSTSKCAASHANQNQSCVTFRRLNITLHLHGHLCIACLFLFLMFSLHLAVFTALSFRRQSQTPRSIPSLITLSWLHLTFLHPATTVEKISWKISTQLFICFIKKKNTFLTSKLFYITGKVGSTCKKTGQIQSHLIQLLI